MQKYCEVAQAKLEEQSKEMSDIAKALDAEKDAHSASRQKLEDSKAKGDALQQNCTRRRQLHMARGAALHVWQVTASDLSMQTQRSS
jgi:hypothetical protein